MPIIKSAIKRAKQAQTRRSRNLVVKRAIRTDVKAVHAAVAAGDTSVIADAVRAAVSEIDRAVKKGTLHRNTAARQKSRLIKKVKVDLGVSAKPVKAKPKAAKPAVKKATTKKPAAKKAAK
jgi:small subunit ribosomal protein S20